MKLQFLMLATVCSALLCLHALPVNAQTASKPVSPNQAAATDSNEQSPPDAARAKAGAGHYHSYCARCHGLKMATTNAASYDLRRFPQDNKPRFVKSVKNGKRAMPAWKNTLSDTQIEDLWHYVLSGG